MRTGSKKDRRRAYRSYCSVCSSIAVGALSMRCAVVFELFSSGQSGETGTRTQSSVCRTPSVRAVYVLSLLGRVRWFLAKMRLTSIYDTRQDIPYLVPGPSYLHTVSDTGTSYWYVHIPCQHICNTYVPGMSSTLAGNIIHV